MILGVWAKKQIFECHSKLRTSRPWTCHWIPELSWHTVCKIDADACLVSQSVVSQSLASEVLLCGHAAKSKGGGKALLSSKPTKGSKYHESAAEMGRQVKCSRGWSSSSWIVPDKSQQSATTGRVESRETVNGSNKKHQVGCESLISTR